MSEPLSQLPPLDLLRGFVAVGRRMSITQAAADLCLTQSAVSRQVQALEQRLGRPLLARGYRAVQFTPEGERLFRIADAAVQQLQEVLGSLRDEQRRRPVTLSASVGFTALWLLPRLGRLQARHPGVDLRVAASNRVADLRQEGIDLAIRYSGAARAPQGALRLFGETIAPVLHPSLVARPWRQARALKDVVLLEFDEPRYPWLKWSGWLAVRGWPDARSAGLQRFNQYDLTIQAALAAQGAALGRLELIGPLLASGQLMRADEAPPQRSQHAYWLLAGEAEPRADVRRVAEWLQAEAAASAQDMSNGSVPA